MRYLRAHLGDLPRAAVVVEDRYSQIFALGRVRPAVVADAVAECAARFPQVPILFCETRALAQEWTYRFFGAALQEAAAEAGSEQRIAALTAATAPSAAEIRAWARANGYDVSDRGRIRTDVLAAFQRRNT